MKINSALYIFFALKTFNALKKHSIFPLHLRTLRDAKQLHIRELSSEKTVE